MWHWFYSGWLLLLIPLVMMFACIVMCVLARPGAARGCMGCCGRPDGGTGRR